MKKLLPLLLVLSLAANAVLLFHKPGSASPDKTAATAKNDDAAARVPIFANPKLPTGLAAALASGDEAALRAAGFSEDEARGLVLTRLFTRLVALLRDAGSGEPGAQGKYWQGGGRGRRGGFTPERQAALDKLEKEFRDTITKSFGDGDFGFFTDNNRYRYLPRDRREQVQSIERDYDEMMAELRKQQEGISMPSDRAKFELLQKEKERDLLAALTPEERLIDELRNSTSANIVRSRYGDLIQDEESYKKIYALQKAFDEKYPRVREAGQGANAETSAARAEAQRKLNEEVRTLIGEEAIVAYKKENDNDLKALNALQTRLNLPAGTAEQVHALRETYAAQSQSIHADASLTTAQRRERLTALAVQAKAAAAARLGQEGAEAYAQRSSWISLLNNGRAFSTNPADATGDESLCSSVYALRPRAKGAGQPQAASEE